MEEEEEAHQFGWIPDHPDLRDYTEDLREDMPEEARRELKSILRETSVRSPEQVARISLPASVDLRRGCSPIEDQKSLNSCTANAGVGVIEL